MKNIIICSDGTWNTPRQIDRNKLSPTNVSKIHSLLSPKGSNDLEQISLYDQGIGTEGNLLRRLYCGITGEGLIKNIKDCYRFLVETYTQGDPIYLYGFSRGAYTIRSLVGLLDRVGLVESTALIDEAFYRYRSPVDSGREIRNHFKPQIEMLAVWDTVGSLGIPTRWNPYMKKHQFHNVKLSSLVNNAIHALAIDEKRVSFKPTLWETSNEYGGNVEQRWFAGVHQNIGGGYSDSGLSDISLQWVIDKSLKVGLGVDMEKTAVALSPRPGGELRDSMTWYYRILGKLDRKIQLGLESIDASVKVRLASQDYSPSNRPEGIWHRYRKIKNDDTDKVLTV